MSFRAKAPAKAVVSEKGGNCQRGVRHARFHFYRYFTTATSTTSLFFTPAGFYILHFYLLRSSYTFIAHSGFCFGGIMVHLLRIGAGESGGVATESPRNVKWIDV